MRFPCRDRFRSLTGYHIHAGTFTHYGPVEGHEPLMVKSCWHFDLAHKYEHAASYPWLPVAPDLPEPK